MHRAVFILGALGLAAGCGDYAGPSGPRNVYALARVGLNHLPVPLNGNGNSFLLVADTFRLVQDRPHADQQILRQTTVISDGPGGKAERSEAQFIYRIENGTLSFDNCPIGAFCLAELVYAPRVFQIVGDSLFEVLPTGANIPPHVYGLVRY